MAAIEVVGLRKTYRGGLRKKSRVALDGLDLIVPEGGVHGFLGPNGSGKTTTLRILMGLVRADAGQVRVLGREIPAELATAVTSVGSMVEGPRFFPAFTGRRNLTGLAQVAGLPASRVDEVLETVGLGGRADDRVKGYSLGMRQRLGIAAALMRRPKLLLLDEPTNGLDPAGIREVRTLMADLGRSGTTVLLSSHLLSEVQQICSSVTIVARGRAVRTGSVDDVLSVAGPVAVRVRVTEPKRAADVLTGGGLGVTWQEPWLVVTGAGPGVVNQRLGEQGIWAEELSAQHAGLEDVFIELTEGAGL